MSVEALLLQEQSAGFEEEVGMLMESWPDDAEHGTLAAALRALLPARPSESWADGETLVSCGDSCQSFFFKVEDGTVELERFEEVEASSDEEGEEEVI